MISYYAIPGIPRTDRALTSLSSVQDKIIRNALTHFGIDFNDLTRKTKAPIAVYRRAIISYLLYTTGQFTLMDIASLLDCSYNSIGYYKTVVQSQLDAKRENEYKSDISAITSLLSNNKPS